LDEESGAEDDGVYVDDGGGTIDDEEDQYDEEGESCEDVSYESYESYDFGDEAGADTTTLLLALAPVE
jgi:hypothetical protein